LTKQAGVNNLLKHYASFLSVEWLACLALCQNKKFELLVCFFSSRIFGLGQPRLEKNSVTKWESNLWGKRTDALERSKNILKESNKGPAEPTF